MHGFAWNLCAVVLLPQLLHLTFVFKYTIRAYFKYYLEKRVKIHKITGILISGNTVLSKMTMHLNRFVFKLEDIRLPYKEDDNILFCKKKPSSYLPNHMHHLMNL